MPAAGDDLPQSTTAASRAIPIHPQLSQARADLPQLGAWHWRPEYSPHRRRSWPAECDAEAEVPLTKGALPTQNHAP